MEIGEISCSERVRRVIVGLETVRAGSGVDTTWWRCVATGEVLHVIQRREVMGRPRQNNTVLGRGRHIPFQSHLTLLGSYKLPVLNRPLSISLNDVITDISSSPISSLLAVITIADQTPILNSSRFQRKERNRRPHGWVVATVLLTIGGISPPASASEPRGWWFRVNHVVVDCTEASEECPNPHRP